MGAWPRPLWSGSLRPFSATSRCLSLNANLTTIMRTQVPIDMQGRVFAARDTLQYITIPLGLTLGGQLADRVFEPFMASGSPLAAFSRSLSAQDMVPAWQSFSS